LSRHPRRQHGLRAKRGWLLLALPLVAGCNREFGSVCTASFAFISAVALDDANQPVSGLVVRDSVIRTVQGFAVSQVGLPGGSGTFTIFSDNYLASVREGGDSVVATGTAAGKSFSAVYEFGSDGCHVRKIAGPDTVVLH